MKKIIFITLVIITLIVGTTGVLVTKLKSDLEQGNIGITIVDKEDDLEFDNKTENLPKEEIVKEKTLDLYGTYNQNDLLIIDEKLECENVNKTLEICQIKGMKNKEIENKINDDIKNKISKAANEFFVSENMQRCDLVMYETANFSNVISFYCNLSYKNTNNDWENFYLNMNYNLVDGQEISFNDMFTSNADIQTIIRDSLYKKIEKDSYSTPFWDEKLGKWMHYGWNENCEEIIEEYVPPLTENEIRKIIQQFVNGIECSFSFTPSVITIHEPKYFEIKFEDFADMVTIYDKYLTDESLYEDESIGVENIITCSREDLGSLYKKASYETENFFYDITVDDYWNPYKDKEHLGKYTKFKAKECIEWAAQTVEEYRTLAKENPDKMYIVLLDFKISLGKGNFKNSNKESDYEYHNLISIHNHEKIISGDIAQKDEFLYKLFGTYRYQNLSMYGSICEGVNMVGHSPYHFEAIEENREHFVVDIFTDKELKDIKDLFKDDIDYKKVLEDVLRDEYEFQYYYDDGKRIYRTEEELEDIFSKIEYRLYSWYAPSIYAYEEDKYKVYDIIKLSNKKLAPYLNIKKLESYIFPTSNTLQLAKEEIQNLDKETLNKAYNEIFARHGHDFKSKELKEYFNKMTWYTPIENKSVTMEELNEIEKYNANLIKSVIAEK